MISQEANLLLEMIKKRLINENNIKHFYSKFTDKFNELLDEGELLIEKYDSNKSNQ